MTSPEVNVGSIVGSGSIHAGGINLREALSGLQDAPLRGPYRAAEREVDGYTTILVQHFFRAFEGEFGSANALSCSSEFQRQNIGRHPATVGVQSVHHGLLTHGGAVRSLFTLVLRRLAACSQAGAGALASCLASLCGSQCALPAQDQGCGSSGNRVQLQMLNQDDRLGVDDAAV